MTDATICPCCRMPLDPGRHILLYLSTVPRPRDRDDPAVMACTPLTIFRHVRASVSHNYLALKMLVAEGLVEEMSYWAYPHLRGHAHVYHLTEEGQRIAANLRAEGAMV